MRAGKVESLCLVRGSGKLVRKGAVVEGAATHAWCAAVAVHTASAWAVWSWAHRVVEAGASCALEASGAVGERPGLLLVGQVARSTLLALVTRVCCETVMKVDLRDA